MTTSTEEFKNATISVTITQAPGCQVTFAITVAPIATQAARKKAIRLIGKEVSVPGFRKGKAPDAMILKKYGQHVEKEWKEIVIRTALTEAMNLSKIFPYKKESIKKPQVDKISLEEGAVLTIEFESSPKLPSISPEEWEFTPVAAEPVTERQLEKTLSELQYHFGEWEEVKERPAQEGDFIDIDIEDLDSKKMLCTAARFYIKEKEMGDWMRDLVIGLNSGDSAEGMSEWEESVYTDTPKDEFKPIRCKITIRNIYHATPFPVNEELAKKVGVKDVEDLKDKMKKDLEKKAEQAAKEKMRQKAETLLKERYPFEIPHSLLQSEKQFHLQTALQRAPSNPTSEELKKLEDELEKKAAQDLRLLILAQEIASKKQISVSENEVRQDVIKKWASAKVDGVKETELPQFEQVAKHSYVELLLNKVLDFLIDSAIKTPTP